MDSQQLQSRRAQRAQERRRRMIRRRHRRVDVPGGRVAGGAVAVASAGGGSSPAPPPRRRVAPPGRPGRRPAVDGSPDRHRTAATEPAAARPRLRWAAPTGIPARATVPVLMYHVIAPPPARRARSPACTSTPAASSRPRCRGCKAPAGTRSRSTSCARTGRTARGCPSGKPIVITFDNGYHSQYTQALPILRRMGWVADENIQLSGLPPSQGGMTDAEVRAPWSPPAGSSTPRASATPT